MKPEDIEKLREHLCVIEGLSAQMAEDTRNNSITRAKARTQIRSMEQVWALLRHLPYERPGRPTKKPQDQNAHLGGLREHD